MSLYFIGIVAPDGINRQVLEWKNYMLKHYQCRVALRSPAHITLVPPFNFKQADEAQLIDSIDEFAGNQAPFPVELSNFSSFPPGVIFIHVVPSEHLNDLQKNCEEFMDNRNWPVKKSTRPFHPHITIANRDLRKQDYPDAFRHFKSVTFKSSFNADQISILRSEPGGWNIIAGLAMKAG